MAKPFKQRFSSGKAIYHHLSASEVIEQVVESLALVSDVELFAPVRDHAARCRIGD